MNRSEPIRFTHHDADLAGTLYRPDRTGRAPVVIVLHAAQGGTRSYPFYQHLTTALPAAGIAVLLYDRRGAGESTGSFETADFALLAGDACAAVEAISAHPAVDAQRVGLYGISQGGWIAPIVAAQSRSVALLTIVSGCGVSPAEQMLYSWSGPLSAGRAASSTFSSTISLRAYARSASIASGDKRPNSLNASNQSGRTYSAVNSLSVSS